MQDHEFCDNLAKTSDKIFSNESNIYMKRLDLDFKDFMDIQLHLITNLNLSWTSKIVVICYHLSI